MRRRVSFSGPLQTPREARRPIYRPASRETLEGPGREASVTQPRTPNNDSGWWVLSFAAYHAPMARRHSSARDRSETRRVRTCVPRGDCPAHGWSLAGSLLQATGAANEVKAARPRMIVGVSSPGRSDLHALPGIRGRPGKHPPSDRRALLNQVTRTANALWPRACGARRGASAPCSRQVRAISSSLMPARCATKIAFASARRAFE